MPVSTAMLKQIAAYGGIFALGSAAYFFKRIQDNLSSGTYYSKSVQILSEHKGATEVLGLPVKTKFIDLGNRFNAVSANQANLAIPVRGSMRKGILYSWSTRAQVEEDWTVQRLDLEVTLPNRKVTIYVAPSSGQTLEMNQESLQPLNLSTEIEDR